MTAVAPRIVTPSSASAGPVPAVVARPADRSDVTGARDFEAVLLEHGGKDQRAPRPVPKDRDGHTPPRRSPSDHADRTGQPTSTTAASPAGPASPPADTSPPGTGGPGVAGATTTTPVAPEAVAQAVGAAVLAEAPRQVATASQPADPTAPVPTPVAADAAPAVVVPGTPTTAGQAVAAPDGAAVRTVPAGTGRAAPGAATAVMGVPGRPTVAAAADQAAVDGSHAAVTTATVVTSAVTSPNVTTPTTSQAAAGPADAAHEQAVGVAEAGSAAYALGTVTTAPTGAVPTAPAAGDARPAQPALPPKAQVLNAVSPLLTTADGTHRLTVHLAPAHLGSVQVHLEVRGGEVTVRLTAVDPATGDALRQGTPELRAHLERIGLRSAGIDVQVAPGDPARDPAAGGSATADRGSRDQEQRDHDQRDAGPWPGGDGADRGGDTARDGGWQRHGRPLEGWTPRADGSRPARDAPGAPDQLDPHRPRPRDVRVDVRM